MSIGQKFDIDESDSGVICGYSEDEARNLVLFLGIHNNVTRNIRFSININVILSRTKHGQGIGNICMQVDNLKRV